MTKTQSDRDSQKILLADPLPLFVASGVILMPQAHMPINIFEDHYLNLIDDALGQGRTLGVIQPAQSDPTIATPPLYSVGTVGRIISFAETEDGRYIVNVLGISRFRLVHELSERNGYRLAKVDHAPYESDLTPSLAPDYDRGRLMNVLRAYFKIHNIAADWSILQNAASEELIASLAMICPLEPSEKQALLEAPSVTTRAELMTALLEMATLQQHRDGDPSRH